MTPAQNKRIREALINGSQYLDEVNRERDRYLAGLITVEELERRVADVLAQEDQRSSVESRDGRPEPAQRDQGEAVGSAEHGAPSPDAASRTPTPWELWRDIDPELFGGGR